MQQISLQHRTLQAYLTLSVQQASWQHRLAVIEGGETNCPFAYAAVAAGACVLWIEGSAAALREASEALLTDFTVDSLSEALRVLKNEVRKGLPVCVGLQMEPSAAWREMVHRGVQPDALLAADPEAAVLVERGARPLGDMDLAQVVTVDAANWRERKANDAVLLLRLGAAEARQTRVARQWLTAASRLFPRDLHRCWAATWTDAPDDTSEGETA